MSTTTMSFRVTPELRDKLNRLSAQTRRSNAYLVAEAVAAYVDRELEIIDGIQAGLAERAAGEAAVPHHEVVADLMAILEDIRNQKA